ncbi:NADH:flavin oxidoreductase [Limnohabitans sp.]|uniref:NADH:flavin oxidoreductase n=1 Tax=Limnohabitans sp. TaxID=1907725 RepID=UPI0025C283C8|nr:NADH:flavin oxidoreductase [Limnohabitans sp.]
MSESTKRNVLFDPLKIGGMSINGRIIKTATTETMSTEDGFVTDELVAFYEPYAEAGTPLIITGNFYTQRSGRVYKRMPGADHDDKIPGMKRIADIAHRHGSKICAQLSHAGRQVFQPGTNDDPVSASAVSCKSSGIQPREMRIDEIRSFVDGFARAAERCKRAGFDAVQVHASQGYLLSQFLTPYTNRRTDAYGGSFNNRLRILLDILRAVRERVGASYPILIKLNGDDALPLRKGLKTPELVKIAQVLQDHGVDAVEISVGHYESGFPTIRGNFNQFFDTLLNEGVGQEYPRGKQRSMRLSKSILVAVCNRVWPHSQGFNLAYAEQFKRALKIPVICVGGFSEADAMAKAIDNGQCDAVSIARAMIADPYLVRHIRKKEPVTQCKFCSACLAHIGARALDCSHPEVRAERTVMMAREKRV